MVPSRVSVSSRQEWQIVFESDKVHPGDGSGCRIIGEASYTTLRSHAGPLHEPAVSLLQQSARTLLQQGYVYSAKSTASDGETRVLGRGPDRNANPSINFGVSVATTRDEQLKAAPPLNDWEFI